MQKLVDFMRRHPFVTTALGIVFIIAFPLVLNKLFHVPAENEWLEYKDNTGDILTYYVSCFSVAATVFLGVVAYNQNKRLIKLECDNKKVLLKINLEKSKVLSKDGKTLIVLENLGSNPIQSLNIINQKDRLIKNEFPENDYENQYVFITNVSSDIKDNFSYNAELNEYCFDLSEYKGKFKILCFGTECESLYGEKSKQVFNVFIVNNTIKDFRTKQI